MPGSLGLCLVGLALFLLCGAVTVLTRSGVWRSWMNPMFRHWMNERLVLLFTPLLAITGLGMALMFIPADLMVVRLLGAFILLTTVLPWVFTVVLTFIGIPRWFYPSWAREIMDRRPFGG